MGEAVLIARARLGDEEAEQAVMSSNFRLVISRAAKSARDRSEIPHLFSIGAEGALGLEEEGGEELPDPESGWSAYRSMGRTSAAGLQNHIKLLNPREEVKNVLDMVGFGNVFQIFTDLDEAVKSF